MQNYNYEYKHVDESSFSTYEERGPFFHVDDSWFHDFVDGDRLFGDFCYEDDNIVTLSDSSDRQSFLTPAVPVQSSPSIPIHIQRGQIPSIPNSPPSTTASDYEDSMSIFSNNSSFVVPSKLLCPDYLSNQSGSDKLVNKRERNRQAAERCRRRKADLISTLQADCEALRRERETLMAENARLRAMLK